MALDASINENFNTRNPEEAVGTTNTDFERKKSATILGNDQMDEVREKLDSVHKLLRKQVCLVEDAEAVDIEGRAEGSQHQKPYVNNYSNNNRGYGNSYYQKPPPPTQESKIEEMFDMVLEGQQRMKVDFNGMIDSVYTNLNTKFETLSTHVKKLEMQVVQTGEVVKRQEALTRAIGDEVMKHHVNAIIDDDFWQLVKQEKLQEGDFEVESLMSFGGSHWCRSTPDFEHRSVDFNQN
ncbi:hypothetical protein Bca4012_098486 [Brassica carinata]